MNPIQKYFENIFAFKRVVGGNTELSGLVRADRLLQELVQDKKVPGLAITVLKSDKVYFQKGYGFADLENGIRVHPQKTIFRIASVSKPIAATALAKMVEEKIMDLDTSFYKYVPYYPKKEYDFTIRQLACHTAGIRGYQGMEYGLNRPYTILESIQIFKDDNLLFKPGTDYHYNSYDWVLISLAMQEASGIPFETYVQEKVLQPLGMTNTFPEITEKKHPKTAIFYTKKPLGFREAIPVNNFYKLAGGGYLSTSEDIATFGQAYLNGELLEPWIRSQFLTSETVNGSPTYYGLGWQVSQDKKGRSYFGHVGNGVGGYSNFLVYPNEQMVVSILINCTDPKVQRELDGAVDVLMTADTGI